MLDPEYRPSTVSARAGAQVFLKVFYVCFELLKPLKFSELHIGHNVRIILSRDRDLNRGGLDHVA